MGEMAQWTKKIADIYRIIQKLSEMVRLER
jgi:hypothetical protein